MPLRSPWSAARVALALVAALVVAAPLARGGVDVPIRIAALATAAAALALAARPGPAPVGLAGAALLGVSAFVALQLVPLPPAVLRALSPATAAHLDAFLGPLGLYPAARPLSLDPGATAGALAKALACACAALAAGALAADRGRRDALLAAAALAGSAVAGATLFAALAGLTSAVEPRFVFVNPNHLAALLDLTAFVALGFAIRERGARRWSWAFAFAGAAMVVLLTLSRAGIAALLVGSAAFVLLLARRARHRGTPGHAARWLVLPAALAAAAAAGLFLAAEPLLRAARTLPGVSQEAKLAMWPVAARLAGEFPVAGIGRGAYPTVFAGVKLDPSPVTFTHVENEWLQAVVDLGFPAGLLALAAIAWSFVAAVRRRDLSRPEIGAAAGLAALGAHSAFDFALDLLGVAIPAFVLLAVISRGEIARLPRRAALALAVAAIALGSGGLLASVRTDADAVSAAIAISPPDAAQERARRAASWHPADHLPQAAAGAALVRAGRCGEAMPWLSRAMLLSPTAAVPHRYVADCLAQAGQRDLALREYRLAHAFGDAGALAAAADRYPTLEDLLGVVPETPEGLRGAGERLLAHGRPSEAVEAYRRAWETYGDRAALEPLARAALGAGDAPGAAEAARTLSELEPHRPAGHLILFRALSSQGHPAEAWAALEAGAALAPGSLELLEPLADRAASEGRYAEARRLLASVVPRNAADAASRLVVEARVLRRQGRLGEAARLLEAAAATGPRSAARQEEYADVLVAMGRYDDAIASLRRAAALPGSEAAVYAEKIRVVEMKAAERRP